MAIIGNRQQQNGDQQGKIKLQQLELYMMYKEMVVIDP